MTMFYGVPENELSNLQIAANHITRIFKRIFLGDNLIAIDKNMGFFDDPEFYGAFQKHAASEQEKSLVWRLHTLAWATKHCLHMDGDFVECGVFKGFSTSVIASYLDFAKVEKKWFLYDTFNPAPTSDSTSGQEDPDDSFYREVLNKFSGYPNIHLVRGFVPDTFAKACPDSVAFLHLDMNNAPAEIGALNTLFDRVSKGGIIVLDDYGWLAYREQKLAEDRFFEERGYTVLETPTGQGILIKR